MNRMIKFFTNALFNDNGCTVNYMYAFLYIFCSTIDLRFLTFTFFPVSDKNELFDSCIEIGQIRLEKISIQLVKCILLYKIQMTKTISIKFREIGIIIE